MQATDSTALRNAAEALPVRQLDAFAYNLGKEYENRISIEQYLKTQPRLIVQLHRVLREDGSLAGKWATLLKMGKYTRSMFCIIRFSKNWV